MSDYPEDGGATLHDGDMALPEALQSLFNLGLPHRIYGEAFKGKDDRSELEVACLIFSLIDAAVWGAQNPEWVMEFAEHQRKAAEGDEGDDVSEAPL